jgi:hypothetical protein
MLLKQHVRLDYHAADNHLAPTLCILLNDLAEGNPRLLLAHVVWHAGLLVFDFAGPPHLSPWLHLTTQVCALCFGEVPGAARSEDCASFLKASETRARFDLWSLAQQTLNYLWSTGAEPHRTLSHLLGNSHHCLFHFPV